MAKSCLLLQQYALLIWPPIVNIIPKNELCTPFQCDIDAKYTNLDEKYMENVLVGVLSQNNENFFWLSLDYFLIRCSRFTRV